MTNMTWSGGQKRRDRLADRLAVTIPRKIATLV